MCLPFSPTPMESSPGVASHPSLKRGFHKLTYLSLPLWDVHPFFFGDIQEVRVENGTSSSSGRDNIYTDTVGSFWFIE